MAATPEDVARNIIEMLDGVESVVAIEGMATALSVIFVKTYRDISVEGFDTLANDMRNNIKERVRKGLWPRP